MKFNLLISVYHRHLKGMNVSGPKDPSARLFALNVTQMELVRLVAFARRYTVVRYIVRKDTADFVFTDLSCDNLKEPDSYTMRPALLTKFTALAHDTTYLDLSQMIVGDLMITVDN